MSDNADLQTTEESEKTAKENSSKNSLAFITDPLDLSQFAQDKLLKMHETEIVSSIEKVKKEISLIEQELGGTVPQQGDEEDWQTFEVPEHCIPIRSDVRSLNWDTLGQAIQFDVIIMDPPWQLASSAPSRGVAIGYQQLPDKSIALLPIPKLQTNGFLFIWVINARYSFAMELFEKWGYEFVDDITWVKTTVNRRMAKSHGYYLQHAKETCLVGRKGKALPNLNANALSDIILAERRGQSQKPEEIYHMIESFVPNGKYLEIFARRNNLRNYWVSIGNEL